MGDTGYALNMVSPVRHVATELDRAAPAALSISELVAGYNHIPSGDLSRVRQHENCASDLEATEWIIRHAVQVLTKPGRRTQVEQDGDRYRLAEDITFSSLRYDGKPLIQLHDEHVLFGDPFNPMSGRFADNIRTDPVAAARDGMDELRDSMRSLGWVPEFPALRDSRGVTLTGHRRLRVAAELRAEGLDMPDQVRVLDDIGNGDAADARRLRITLASNMGFKPMTPTDRKAIAESLYEGGWTMDRIGEALAVSEMTVSRDLSDFKHDVRNRTAKDGTRRGRPKGTPKDKPPGSPKPAGTHVKSQRTSLERDRLDDPEYVAKRLKAEVSPATLHDVASLLDQTPPPPTVPDGTVGSPGVQPGTPAPGCQNVWHERACPECGEVRQ